MQHATGIEGRCAKDRPPKLTVRQREILTFIYERICQEGCRPTFREIMAASGINSTNGISCHFAAFARAGYIRWRPNHAGRPGTKITTYDLLRWPDGRPFRGLIAAPDEP